MVICAAIQVTFRGKSNIEKTVVIPGWRHSSYWELMSPLGVPADRQEVEGFLTHTGDFLDRYEAFAHALMCGQLSDTTRAYKASQGERQLFSEDLY